MRNFFPRCLWALLAIALAFQPFLAYGRAVISEVMWMGSDLSTADEWVEIAMVATGTGSATLSGWTLTSLNSAGQETVLYRFGSGAVIDAFAPAVISNYPAVQSRLASDPRFVSTALSLPNTKLLLRLRDGSGTVMDEVDDGVGATFAGANPSGGIKASMERLDLSLPGNVKENWATAIVSLGFDSGALVLGTPGFAFGSVNSSLSSINSSSSSNHTETIGNGQSSSNNSEQSSSSISSVLSSSASSVSSSFVSSVTSISSESFASAESSDGAGSASSASSSSSVASSAAKEDESSIKITELLPDAEGIDDASWIELGNLGSVTVDITGWTLEAGTKKFAIPSRSASGFLLQPGEHVSFRKTETKLSMLHARGTVILRNGDRMMDAFSYSDAKEGVSFVRGEEGIPLLICVPTEGAANREPSWNPVLSIQSGKVRDEERVTINLEAVIPAAFAGMPHCFFDFGDGAWVESCNPGAHVYDRVGRYTVQAKMDSYCGNTVIQELTIEVTAKSSSSVSSSSIASVNTGGGGGGSPSLMAVSNSSFSSFSSSSQAVSLTSTASASCVPDPSARLVISEILPDPEGSDTEGEWVELLNESSEEALLCGWALGTASSKKPFSLAAFSIPALSFLHLPRAVTGLTLRNSQETLRLSGPAEFGGTQVYDEVTYGKPKAGYSFARRPDGTFAWTSLLTPGEANQFDAEAPVQARKKITKVVQKNAGSKGAKKKTTPKKIAQKTPPKTSSKVKRQVTSSQAQQSESAPENESLEEDGVPLLAMAEKGTGEGWASKGWQGLSVSELLSLLGNGVLLAAIALKKVYAKGP